MRPRTVAFIQRATWFLLFLFRPVGPAPLS